MLVVNLLGEPGVGKSVTAAGLYYELAIHGFKTEIIPEVAKGYAWETPKDPHTGKALLNPIFKQQNFLLAEQNRVLERVIGQREIAIMECPLIMMGVYKPENYLKHFEDIVLEQFNAYHNFNILLERNHAFDPDGRVHDEEESKHVRTKLQAFLEKHKIPHTKIQTCSNINKKIAKMIQEQYFIDRYLSY